MKLWPRSLMGQMMLAVALALLAAQAIGAVLAYRAGAERREAALLHTAANRLLAATRLGSDGHLAGEAYRMAGPGFRARIERSVALPAFPGERRDREAEETLRGILADQDFASADVLVVRRPIATDEPARRRLARQSRLFGSRHAALPTDVMIAAVQLPDRGGWLAARVFVPPGERMIVISLLVQTLFIYAVLFAAIALILRRITRPLAALTERLERFAATRSLDGQLVPQGPDDVRRLIDAHNAMEARIAALLDEKDVMLGAIGHDLKTPLAALRVRIESVEDDTERARMAATIEDITRSLDDILSLARVGRPGDPVEKTEISALLASVVEEYEDMGKPVALGNASRLVLAVRATWLRRAFRNLIDNALRYGQTARVSLQRESSRVSICIEDDGPGIDEAQIERMFEPFSRGEPSRNTATGGAGLGLTLARAIAEQHGGELTLRNRRNSAGETIGLAAKLSLPIT